MLFIFRPVASPLGMQGGPYPSLEDMNAVRLVGVVWPVVSASACPRARISSERLRRTICRHRPEFMFFY